MNGVTGVIVAGIAVCVVLVIVRKVKQLRNGQFCDCGCGNCKKCKK